MPKTRITDTEKIKSELYSKNKMSPCCRASELLAFLLVDGSLEFSRNRQPQLIISSHSPSTVKRAYMHFVFFNLPSTHFTVSDKRLSYTKLFKLTLPGPDALDRAMECLTMSKLLNNISDTESIFRLLALKNFSSSGKCCDSSFMRALFISRGSLSCSGGYNLEININDPYLLERICGVFKKSKIPLKIRKRGNKHLGYIKSSESVHNFLIKIGAHKMVMALMDKKIIKELKNNVNRSMNFDQANLNKTVKAAQKQIEILMNMKNTKTFLNLNEKLQETARIRLDNPYENYTALGNLHTPAISKATVQYRLNKLARIFKENIDTPENN
jgi:DNA-binding protein WhiA